MIPINNSDTAWLIVADYNQDNSIGYPDGLREDVYCPEINNWTYNLEGSTKNVGDGFNEEIGDGVGGNSNHTHCVGNNSTIPHRDEIFSIDNCSGYGDKVGGHWFRLTIQIQLG